MLKSLALALCLLLPALALHAEDEEPTSVRVKFVTPAEYPPGHKPKPPSWMDKFRPMMSDKEGPNLMYWGWAGIHESFPAKRDEQVLFRVAVTGGDDSELKAEIRHEEREPIKLTLKRDDMVRFEFDDVEYAIRFASNWVSSEEDESAFITDNAHIMLFTPKDPTAKLEFKKRDAEK